MYDNISITGEILPPDTFYNGDTAKGDRALTNEEKALLTRGWGYKIENHQIIDITQTEEYIKNKRLKEIEDELRQADEAYDKVLQTPVTYTNGFRYKPGYVQESYVLLIAADIFPITIWDADETNPVEMNKTDLLSLSLFLKAIAEPAFQERKETRKALIEERQSLRPSKADCDA